PLHPRRPLAGGLLDDLLPELARVNDRLLGLVEHLAVGPADCDRDLPRVLAGTDAHVPAGGVLQPNLKFIGRHERGGDARTAGEHQPGTSHRLSPSQGVGRRTSASLGIMRSTVCRVKSGSVVVDGKWASREGGINLDGNYSRNGASLSIAFRRAANSAGSGSSRRGRGGRVGSCDVCALMARAPRTP